MRICASSLVFRFHCDAQVILRDVIAHRSALILRRAEQQIDRLQLPHGSLRIEIELAQRFDFVAEKFRAHRQLRLPGKEIENPAAHGELAARRHLRDAFVAGVGQRLEQCVHRLVRAAFDPQRGRLQRAQLRRRLIEAGARGDDEMRSGFARNSAEQREAFRGDFRIGQNVFDRGEFRFREKERVGHPVQKTLVENLLRANRRADDPKVLRIGPRCVATRRGCAGAVTCEKRTGHAFLAIAANCCAMGAACATRSRMRSPTESCTGNASPVCGGVQFAPSVSVGPTFVPSRLRPEGKRSLSVTDPSDLLDRMRILFRAALRSALLIALVTPVCAAALPEVRPAVFFPGPRSLVNLINAEGLMKRGQKDGLVMFDLGVTKLGTPYSPYTYRGTPGSEKLADEVLGQIRRSTWIPAVKGGKPRNAIVFGTVVFAIVDGKPRVRVYLNQEDKELMSQSDFIAPQLLWEAGQKFKIEWPGRPASRNGTVSVGLSLDRTGKVENASIGYESPKGFGFGSEVMRRIRDADFIPAFRKGNPTAARVSIPFFFRAGVGPNWNT